MKKLIYDYSKSELQGILVSWWEPKYRVDQVWNGLYVSLWKTPDEFTSLPRTLRVKLEKKFSFGNLTPELTIKSSDGLTQKTLFRLPDNNAIETVMMIYPKRSHKRITLCISTQSGCTLGCKFCATGQMGFKRNLTSGEIIEQVIYHVRLLRKTDERITNIVYMGMGEPFLNYEATMKSIDIMNASDGMKLGARRSTISTVGIIPGIKRFADEKRRVNLAISLHFTDNQVRDVYMPINKKYPVEDVIDAALYYIEKTNRRVSFEWAMIKGVNDSVEDAYVLANLLQPFIRNSSSLCHVNIIPLNPTKQFDQKASDKESISAFQEVLTKYHIPSSVREKRGIDIGAGCGQLALNRFGE